MYPKFPIKMKFWVKGGSIETPTPELLWMRPYKFVFKGQSKVWKAYSWNWNRWSWKKWSKPDEKLRKLSMFSADTGTAIFEYLMRLYDVEP